MGYQAKVRLAALLVLGGASALMAFYGGRYIQALPTEFSKKSAGVDLLRDASELNKTLPEMVSEGVRLDRTGAGPGKLFHYYYTILDDDQARTLIDHPSRLKEIISQLNDRVCGMMPNYVQNGVVIKYHLKTRIDASLPDIIVDPGVCALSQTGK